MIDLNGKKYYIDIKKVFEMIEYSTKNERKETEITDGYEFDEDEKKLTQISKIVHESKFPPESQTDNIRYDFLKMLVGVVIGNEEPIPDVGTEICFYSLIKQGILVEWTGK